MSSEERAPEAPMGLTPTRLEAFSDGVLAIAITLLVLEISVPDGSDDDLLGALGDQWRSYLAYAVSFATIGAIWLAHATITRYLSHTNPLLVRVNLLLLMVVSFLPFPTRLLAEYGGDDDPARVATTFYGSTLFLAAILVAVLWRYAVKADLLGDDASSDLVAALTLQLTPGLAGYVALIVVGLFFPTLAVIGYLLLAIMLITPFGLLRLRAAIPPA